MNYEWSGREDLRFPRGTSNTTTHLSWMESQIRKGPPPHKPSPYPHTHTHTLLALHIALHVIYSVRSVPLAHTLFIGRNVC